MFDRAHWEHLASELCPASVPKTHGSLQLLRYASKAFWHHDRVWSGEAAPALPDAAYWSSLVPTLLREYAQWEAQLEADHQAQGATGGRAGQPTSWLQEGLAEPLSSKQWEDGLAAIVAHWSAHRKAAVRPTHGTAAQRAQLHQRASALKEDFGLAVVSVEAHQAPGAVIRAIDGLRTELERLTHHLGIVPATFGQDAMEISLNRPRRQRQHQALGSFCASIEGSVIDGHARLYYTVGGPSLQDGLTLAHEWAHLWDARLTQQAIQAPQALLAVLETPWVDADEEAQARQALVRQWGAFVAHPKGLMHLWEQMYHEGAGQYPQKSLPIPLQEELERLQSVFATDIVPRWLDETDAFEGFSRALDWADDLHRVMHLSLEGLRRTTEAQARGRTEHKALRQTLRTLQNGVDHPRAAIELMGAWLDRAQAPRSVYPPAPETYWAAPHEIWARTMEHVVHALDRRMGHATLEACERIALPGYFEGLGVESRVIPWLMEQGPTWGVRFNGLDTLLPVLPPQTHASPTMPRSTP